MMDDDQIMRFELYHAGQHCNFPVCERQSLQSKACWEARAGEESRDAVVVETQGISPT